MKNITLFIQENFSTLVRKCKTFGEFICLYLGVNNIKEITEELFDTYDLGYLLFHDEEDEITYNEFTEWLNDMLNEPITNLKITNNMVLFKCNNELYDLDWIED